MPFTPVTAPSLFKSPAPFSPATITPAGKLLHVSGQVSLGPDGKTIGLGNVALQTETSIENLKALLTAAGASLEDVCRVVIYIVSRDHLAEVIAVRKRYFHEPYPAATVVIVAGLANQEWLVEIEATAALPN
jgi:enamine deaminase RidA (YjgF/YER057c/UK114 family)